MFNSVNPETYSNATDLATTNHSTAILNSHRFYELFVNRETSGGIAGLASGDNPNYKNYVSFMPLGGYAKQESRDGHAGYDKSYVGCVGYWEHDITDTLKGGCGIAYFYNETEY